MKTIFGNIPRAYLHNRNRFDYYVHIKKRRQTNTNADDLIR